MIIDHHTHTKYSPDADTKTTFKTYIEQAKKIGFQGVLFTDHVDFDSTTPLFMDIIDYDKYFQEINQLRRETAFDIRVGVELGYQPQSIDKMEKLVNDYPFDFVIMSMHVIKGLDPYNGSFFVGKTQVESYQAYFDEVLESVKTYKNYDVYGHLDYITRYGDFETYAYDYAKHKETIDDILLTIIKDGKGIELNTSGLDQLPQQPFPKFDILKRYKELGGKMVTIASDAHTTNDLGRHFKFAFDLLKQAGFEEIAMFKHRTPVFVKIP